MRVTGDSVGPRVGDILKARGVNCFVYGDSISNVNAHKLEMYQNLLSVCHAGDIVIAVDAALGENEDVGRVKITKNGLFPGRALGRESKAVGDIGVLAVAALITSISEWEKSYLLVAPADGTVAFMQLWEEKQQVENKETMFVIIPADAITPIGKALLPMEGIGKVKTGQRAIIRLPAFPEQEFGFIEGKVNSISPVPDSQGRYILEISLPKGMVTNYGKQLPLIKSISGTASIVTKERTLLGKLINSGK